MANLTKFQVKTLCTANITMKVVCNKRKVSHFFHLFQHKHLYAKETWIKSIKITFKKITTESNKNVNMSICSVKIAGHNLPAFYILNLQFPSVIKSILSGFFSMRPKIPVTAELNRLCSLKLYLLLKNSPFPSPHKIYNIISSFWK